MPLHLTGKAYAFAEQAHRGQLDRYGLGDFIDHPVAVAELVSSEGDPVMEAAAFLHDTIEKSEVTPEALEAEFGEEIVDLVMKLSRDPDIEDRVERRSDHRQRIRSAGWQAQFIYANDRVDGIRRMSQLLAAGHDSDKIEARRRIETWRGDLAVIGEMNLPAELIATLADEIERLDRLAG